ncbi:putative LRR receptor-like serine/threonine-protein kinase [Apostasia shenzhenica]|uniref:Putative LRR receptor-like serine/threonine-protein kinase n=1 Tax=Apostasia shenzhenica TaxID=1088818 RepID=A0A2I0ABV5_9ASPA|nr:putative LRR receptor-like serine/threonine-protein kinase [Apostasia shenzhenica]
MGSARSPLLLLLAVQCLALFFPSHSLLQQEVLALKAFKRDILEDPLAVLYDWNTLGGEPCSWFGVLCSRAQIHVVALNLSRSSLKGFIAPELGLLSFLEKLILDNNLFFGTIPRQIGNLKNLMVLDFSVNRLTGPIPPDLGNLTSLANMNLHYNGLTGSIPSELVKLVDLVELRVDRNRLTGPILGGVILNSTHEMHNMSASQKNEKRTCNFPRLKIGDFSYNFLIGDIPTCLKNLPRSAFQGNCLRDEYASLQRSPQTCGFQKSEGILNGTTKQSRKETGHPKLQQPEWLLIIEACTVAILFIIFIAVVLTAYGKYQLKPYIKFPWKRHTKWKDISVSIDGEMLKDVKIFNRQELELACEDFSNIIGSSSDSIVYKGTLKNGPEIAVISLCISEDQWTNYLELYFQSKVADLARVNHANTAKLLGYCKENNPFSRMLVFEYASNGTLYEHLHYGEGSQLSWFRRMKITLGIAQGLRYLHTELQPPFSLSELNSSTVYLTEDFTAKLVDFESWKMVLSKSEKNSGQICSGGSLHTLSCSADDLQFDVQCNTFSFGVLLLEIISRRHHYCKEKGRLVDWASEYLQNPDEISKLVDPELKDVKADDLAVLCSVISLCIDPDPSKRPSMQIIAAVLENGIDISAAAVLKDSSLEWANLALAS